MTLLPLAPSPFLIPRQALPGPYASRRYDMTILATAPVQLGGTAWMSEAVCLGHTAVFFAPPGERPEARELREERARSICHTCPVMTPCQGWARENREYGFWGGESEEERAAAGFRVEMPVGRIARYPRGEGKPVQARPERNARQAQRAS
jgi:WhiB family transcriptional regulator, redox-sensing transcriptional regulator